MGTLLSPPGAYAANLCIDMQNLFAPGGPWATPWMERVAPFVAALVERAPERTIFTRFIPPQTKESARGMWKLYYEKWECVTGDRLAALAQSHPCAGAPCTAGRSHRSADLLCFRQRPARCASNAETRQHAGRLGWRNRCLGACDRSCGRRSRLPRYPCAGRPLQLFRS
jgi:hypothetical protein